MKNSFRTLLLLSVLLASSVSASLPEDASVVMVHGDATVLPVAVGDGAFEPPFWWWSEECAPQRVSAIEEIACSGREVQIAVHDRRGEPVEGAEVVWGSEKMVAELQDDLLPFTHTDEHGLAHIIAPEGSSSLVRARAESQGSLWREIASGETRMRITTEPARDLRIEISGEDGHAPSNAWVKVSSDERTAALRAASADGKIIVRGVPALSRLELVTWSDSHPPAASTLGPTAENLHLVMPPAGQLSGSVIDSDGEPLEGVSVEVHHVLPAGTGMVARRAESDASGRIHVSGLPRDKVEWVVSSEGRVTRVGAADLSSGIADIGRLTLERARNLEVLVQSAGRPVPGATIVLESVLPGLTGEDGRVTLPGVPAKPLFLEASAPQLLPSSVEVGSDADEVLVSLSAGAVIRARLMSSSGAELGPEIDVQVDNIGRKSNRSLPLQKEQMLELGGLSTGSLIVTIAAPDHLPYRSPTLQVTEGEIHDLGLLVLESGYEITGRVVDEYDQPMVGVTVKSLDALDQGPMLAWVMRAWKETRTDDGGSFHIKGLEPGPQFLVFEPEGRIPAAKPGIWIDPELGPRHDVGALRFPREVNVEVHCTPVEQCGSTAQFLLAGPAFPFLSLARPLENGTARFEAVPPGSWTVRVSEGMQLIHDERVVVRAGEAEQSLEVELPVTSLEGRVLLGSDPPKAGHVRLRRDPGFSLVPIQMQRKSASGSVLSSSLRGTTGRTVSAPVSPDGTFHLSLQPGTYEVSYTEGSASSAAVTITVPEAETYVLPLSFGAGRVSGSIVDPAGEPAPAAVTAIDAAGQSWQIGTGSDGRFQLLGLATGAVRLTALARDRSATATVETSPDRTTEIALTLEDSDHSLTARIRTSTGDPALGVTAYAFDGKQILSRVSDADGLVTWPQGTAAVALAAYSRTAGWAFTKVNELNDQLRFHEDPALASVEVEEPCTARIMHETGFPLHRVLPRLGFAPGATPEAPMILHGLPPGSYTIECGTATENVKLSPGELARITAAE